MALGLVMLVLVQLALIFSIAQALVVTSGPIFQEITGKRLLLPYFVVILKCHRGVICIARLV